MIFPYVRRAAKEGTDSVHVVFVSHGIFIRELVASLLRHGGDKAEPGYRGLKNTGWVLVAVTVKEWQGQSVDASLPRVRIVQYNSCEHLAGLVRQKGGIGSAAYDPNQKDIRSFFKPH